MTDSDFHQPAFAFVAGLDQIEQGVAQAGGLEVRDLFMSVAFHALLTKWIPEYTAGDEATLDVIETAAESAIIAGNAVMRMRAD